VDCERFRRIKDYTERKIRTVFGCVEVSNSRILNCKRCLPHFCDASAVLRGNLEQSPNEVNRFGIPESAEI
jgi:hypothetical protein